MKKIDENELYDLAELFKVFGDSTRIRILHTLFKYIQLGVGKCGITMLGKF